MDKGAVMVFLFFFQAEDGIRDLVRSRGLGDVYKRQVQERQGEIAGRHRRGGRDLHPGFGQGIQAAHGALSLIHI